MTSFDELQRLRNRVADLESELRARDHDQIVREAAEYEAAQQIERELAAQKERDDDAAEMEEHRKRAWVNEHHRVCGELLTEVRINEYKKTFDAGPQIPALGWPEGTNPNDFKKVPAWTAPEEIIAPVETTMLGKALAAIRPLEKI